MTAPGQPNQHQPYPNPPLAGPSPYGPPPTPGSTAPAPRNLFTFAADAVVTL